MWLFCGFLKLINVWNDLSGTWRSKQPCLTRNQNTVCRLINSWIKYNVLDIYVKYWTIARMDVSNIAFCHSFHIKILRLRGKFNCWHKIFNTARRASSMFFIWNGRYLGYEGCGRISKYSVFWPLSAVSIILARYSCEFGVRSTFPHSKCVALFDIITWLVWLSLWWFLQCMKNHA